MKKFLSYLLILCTIVVFPMQQVRAEESSIVKTPEKSIQDADFETAPDITTTTEDEIQYFKLQGSKILDPNGNEFVIKGANVMAYNAAWPVTALEDLELFKLWNFNFARLYTRLDDNYVTGGGPGHNKDLNYLHRIIEAYTAEGIVVMIEVHDFTGSYYTDVTTPSLTDLANFHASLAERFIDNPYVWFNVMNEPGGSGSVSPQWVTTHQRVIKAIRDTGNNSIIVADGASWGQDVGEWNGNPVKEENSAILKYGADLKNFDGNTYENIMFSVHAYDQWANGDAKLIDFIDRVHAKGHALMIGEFGCWNNSYNFNALDTTMRVAPQKGVGLVAWHWYGGDRNRLTVRADGKNGGGQHINKTDGTKPTNLTYFGNLVWDYNHDQLTAESYDNSLEKDPDAVIIPPIVTGNLIENGGFEEGTSKWDNYGGTSYADVDSAYTGTSALKVAAGNRGGRGRTLADGLLKPDTTYILSAYGKVDSGANGDIGFKFIEGANTDYTQFFLHFEEEEEYTYKQLVFTTPTEFKLSKVFIYKNTAEGCLYADNVVLIEVPNLIENGGFEEGTNKWDNYGGTSYVDVESAYTGANGLKVETGKAGGRGRSLPDGLLKPNTTYILSAYGKVDGGANGDIGIKFKEGANTDYTQYFMHFEGEEDYTYKKLMFTTPAEFNTTKIFIYKNTAAGCLYADNMLLTEVPNLIENGGFEDGTNKWDNYGGTSYVDAANAYTGNNGLKVAAGNKGGRGRTLADGVLKPNTTYILSAYGKVDDGANGDIGFKLIEGANTDYKQYFLHFEGEEEYTYKQLMFTTPAEFNSTKIFIYKNTTQGNMYADNVVLTELPSLMLQEKVAAEEESLFELGTVQFKDIVGNTVMVLNASSTIFVDVAVANKERETRAGVLIVAVYDQNDTMVNYATSGTERIEANSSVQLTAGFQLPDDVAGYKIKVFVCDSLDSTKILSPVLVFPNN